jgi:hypothetical protein
MRENSKEFDYLLMVIYLHIVRENQSSVQSHSQSIYFD